MKLTFGRAGQRGRRRLSRESAKAGLPPGTMVFIGEQAVQSARIDLTSYDKDELIELRDVSVERCLESLKTDGVTWVNVNGIHDVDLISSLGKAFDLHALTLEDIVNTAHRPKIEEFPDYLFMVIKMIYFDAAAGQTVVEHVSLVLGSNFVISFQEREGDVFEIVRERLRASKGRIRAMPADYLAYALMDAMVDNYFLVVEHFADRVEELDELIAGDPPADAMREIHLLRREVLGLRKVIWPLREAMSLLYKGELQLIRPETRMFLRDLYDHTIQLLDMIESFREVLGGLHDAYLSATNNRMNEIMKVLTIIATIFIPLTFIAGIYGMNFEHMPELAWPAAYFVVLGVMLLIGAGMLVFFRRKRWL